MSLVFILTGIFAVFAIFYGYTLPNHKKDIRYIHIYSGLTCIVIVWSIYTLGFLNKNLDTYTPKFRLIYIIILIGILLFLKYLRSFVKKPNLEIVAKQMNYWGIDAKKISKFYSYRKINKEDRIDTRINETSKKFYRIYSNEHKFLTGNIFYDIKDIKLTTIKTTDDLNNIELYRTIFNKIKEFNKSAELSVNYEEILKENNFIAEYFLIDCWCRFTKPFNIGIANLDMLATNFTQKELIGAIDNADLNSVKRAGAGLFFKYALFKDLIPKEDEEEQNFSSEDENFSNDDENNSDEDEDF